MDDSITFYSTYQWDGVLPASWARPVVAPKVLFSRHERFGWHVWVEDGTPEEVTIASFPWHDDVDVMLAESTGELPPLPTGPGAEGRWWDMEQGWLLTVTEVEGFVYVANTSPDGLDQEFERTPGQQPVLAEDGVPRLGEVLIQWTRVPAQVWRQAWQAAIADFLARH